MSDVLHDVQEVNPSSVSAPSRKRPRQDSDSNIDIDINIQSQSDLDNEHDASGRLGRDEANANGNGRTSSGQKRARSDSHEEQDGHVVRPPPPSWTLGGRARSPSPLVEDRQTSPLNEALDMGSGSLDTFIPMPVAGPSDSNSNTMSGSSMERPVQTHTTQDGLARSMEFDEHLEALRRSPPSQVSMDNFDLGETSSTEADASENGILDSSISSTSSTGAPTEDTGVSTRRLRFDISSILSDSNSIDATTSSIPRVEAQPQIPQPGPSRLTEVPQPGLSRLSPVNDAANVFERPSSPSASESSGVAARLRLEVGLVRNRDAARGQRMREQLLRLRSDRLSIPPSFGSDSNPGVNEPSTEPSSTSRVNPLGTLGYRVEPFEQRSISPTSRGATSSSSLVAEPPGPSRRASAAPPRLQMQDMRDIFEPFDPFSIDEHLQFSRIGSHSPPPGIGNASEGRDSLEVRRQRVGLSGQRPLPPLPRTHAEEEYAGLLDAFTSDAVSSSNAGAGSSSSRPSASSNASAITPSTTRLGSSMTDVGRGASSVMYHDSARAENPRSQSQGPSNPLNRIPSFYQRPRRGHTSVRPIRVGDTDPYYIDEEEDPLSSLDSPNPHARSPAGSLRDRESSESGRERERLHRLFNLVDELHDNLHRSGPSSNSTSERLGTPTSGDGTDVSNSYRPYRLYRPPSLPPLPPLPPLPRTDHASFMGSTLRRSNSRSLLDPSLSIGIGTSSSSSLNAARERERERERARHRELHRQSSWTASNSEREPDTSFPSSGSIPWDPESHRRGPPVVDLWGNEVRGTVIGRDEDSDSDGSSDQDDLWAPPPVPMRYDLRAGASPELFRNREQDSGIATGQRRHSDGEDLSTSQTLDEFRARAFPGLFGEGSGSGLRQRRDIGVPDNNPPGPDEPLWTRYLPSATTSRVRERLNDVVNPRPSHFSSLGRRPIAPVPRGLGTGGASSLYTSLRDLDSTSDRERDTELFSRPLQRLRSSTARPSRPQLGDDPIPESSVRDRDGLLDGPPRPLEPRLGVLLSDVGLDREPRERDRLTVSVSRRGERHHELRPSASSSSVEPTRAGLSSFSNLYNRLRGSENDSLPTPPAPPPPRESQTLLPRPNTLFNPTPSSSMDMDVDMESSDLRPPTVQRQARPARPLGFMRARDGGETFSDMIRRRAAAQRLEAAHRELERERQPSPPPRSPGIMPSTPTLNPARVSFAGDREREREREPPSTIRQLEDRMAARHDLRIPEGSLYGFDDFMRSTRRDRQDPTRDFGFREGERDWERSNSGLLLSRPLSHSGRLPQSGASSNFTLERDHEGAPAAEEDGPGARERQQLREAINRHPHTHAHTRDLNVNDDVDLGTRRIPPLPRFERRPRTPSHFLRDPLPPLSDEPVRMLQRRLRESEAEVNRALDALDQWGELESSRDAAPSSDADRMRRFTETVRRRRFGSGGATTHGFGGDSESGSSSSATRLGQGRRSPSPPSLSARQQARQARFARAQSRYQELRIGELGLGLGGESGPGTSFPRSSGFRGSASEFAQARRREYEEFMRHRRRVNNRLGEDLFPLHAFSSGFPGTRNLGDYVRDEDFDTSYENLIRLAAIIGDAKPRGTPTSVLDGMPKGSYKDFRTEDCDTRCPICLDDYTEDDAVMKISDCDHWFHDECLKQWLKNNRTCPLCKTIVRGHRKRGEQPSLDHGPIAGPSRRRDDPDSDGEGGGSGGDGRGSGRNRSPTLTLEELNSFTASSWMR